MAPRGDARVRAAREVDLLSDLWTTAKDCPRSFPLTAPLPSAVSRHTLYSTWRSSENKCSLCWLHFRRVEEGGSSIDKEADADVELFHINNIHENGLGYGKSPKSCELYENCVLAETASFLERMRVIIAHIDVMPTQAFRHFSTGCHKVLDLVGPLKRLTAQNPEGWFHVALEMLVNHLILSTAMAKELDRYSPSERTTARASVKSIQETMGLIIKDNKEKTPLFGKILVRKIKAFVRAPQGGMLKRSLKVLLGCAQDLPEIQGTVFDAVIASLVRVRRRQGPEEQQSFFPTKMSLSRNACVVTWVMTAQTFAVQWCKPVAPPRDFDPAPEIARSILERMAADKDLWALAEATFLNDPWVTTHIWKLVPSHPELYKPLHGRPVRTTIRRRETQRPVKDPFELVVLHNGWNPVPESAEAGGVSGVQLEDSVGENLMSEERGAGQQATEEVVDIVGGIRALFEGSGGDDAEPIEEAQSGEKEDDQIALAEGAGHALVSDQLALAGASEGDERNKQLGMGECSNLGEGREDPLASAGDTSDEDPGDDRSESAEVSGRLLEAPALERRADQLLSTACSDVAPNGDQRGTAGSDQLACDEGPVWGTAFPSVNLDSEDWEASKRKKRARDLLSALLNEGPASADELEPLDAGRAAAGGNWELGDKPPRKKRSVRKWSAKDKAVEEPPRKKRSAEKSAEMPPKKRRQKKPAEESVNKPAEKKETKMRKRVSVNYRKKKGPPDRHEQGWGGLQDDLMLDILQRVTPKMTSVAALVCKNWRRVCMLDEAWVHHYKQRFGALPKEKPLNKGGQSNMSWFQAFVQRKTAPYFSRFCPDCGRPYLKKSDLDRHMQRAHTATLTCDLCSEVTRFRSEKGLAWHKREKHEGLKKLETQPFKCDQCHARCKSQEVLDDHRKIMHGGNSELVPFKCTYPGCSFGSRLWHSLKRHCTRSHHPLPEPHLACPREGCTFRGYNKAAVRQHAFTHASNCPECGRVYAPGYDRWSPHPGMPEIGICDACRIKLHRAELKKRQAPRQEAAEEANSDEEWQ